jgi:hypothetical protein
LSEEATSPSRRGELDAMGMLIVVGLVFFHSATIFTGEPTMSPIVSDSQSDVVTFIAMLVASFAGLWGMPLMMLIAGIAVWYSLGRRSAGEFVLERIGRLLVPFVVGLVVVHPPQVYFTAKFWDPRYDASFIEFFKRFWNIEFSLSAFPLMLRGAPPDEKLFGVWHLWFLIYLFVYTLLLLPLLLYLKRPVGRAALERIVSAFGRPGAVLLLALPLGIVEGLLGTDWPGAWSRFIWVFFLAYGFLLASDARMGEALRASRRLALVIGFLLFLVQFGGFGLLDMLGRNPFADPGALAVGVRFVKGLASWPWVVYIMGTATAVARRRSQPSRPREGPESPPGLASRVADYAHEAQLPFYILHHTPITIIGYYVLRWDRHPILQYLVIAFGSMVSTVLVYDFLVRRTGVARFLFGIRRKRRD